MKVKSIFVSMLAIAALASCARQEFIDPPGPKGKEMVVDLTISGSALSTSKAAGAATNATDKTIKDLTVFGVNQTSGAVITKKYFATGELTDDTGTPGNKIVEFATTDQTTEIHVIANIGEDLTVAGKDLNVNSLKSLQNVKASLIVPVTNAPKQTEGNVLMSGSTQAVIPATPAGPGGAGAANGTASVILNFIASKIILTALNRTATSQGVYGTDFTFDNALLTNVQTSAYYVRDAGSYIGEIAAGVRPALAPLTWATGRNGQADQEVTDFNQTISTTNFDNTHPIENVAYWYVFENSDQTKHTNLLIQYSWLKTTDQPMVTQYFPVTFGGGDKPAIEPGQAYAVTLTFNGDFRPENQGGGGGGGGTDDPDTPVVPGAVDVTVTPTDWNDAPTAKPF